MATDVLELDEYLHVINHSLVRGDWQQAQVAAKEAVDYFEHGELYYLYGSICAHQKEFVDAVNWLNKALNTKDSLVSRFPAAFQLGMIHITSGRIADASGAWEELNELPDDHYFRLFSEGMTLLIENQLIQAQIKIEAGLKVNGEFPSINQDMEYALSQIQLALGSDARNSGVHEGHGATHG